MKKRWGEVNRAFEIEGHVRMSVKERILNATPSVAVVLVTIITTVTIVYLLSLAVG